MSEADKVQNDSKKDTIKSEQLNEKNDCNNENRLVIPEKDKKQKIYLVIAIAIMCLVMLFFIG